MNTKQYSKQASFQRLPYMEDDNQSLLPQFLHEQIVKHSNTLNSFSHDLILYQYPFNALFAHYSYHPNAFLSQPKNNNQARHDSAIFLALLLLALILAILGLYAFHKSNPQFSQLTPPKKPKNQTNHVLFFIIHVTTTTTPAP